MSQVDNRNSSAAGKRARTDGGRREDDWTCPSCGNVNFSFRTTCNMRNCTQPRPADHSAKFGAKPQQTPPTFTSGGYMGTGAPSSMYLGAPPYGSPIFNGSALPPYDLPFSGSSGYHYDYGNRLSVGSPYGPLHMSGPPPYSGGSMLGTGGMYGMPPIMDRYGMGMPMGPGSMGPRPGSYYDEVSQKGSADAGRESDWTCPNCGNNNFSFRTVCNMRKCNTPRPGSQASKFEDSKGAKPKMPEGSWKCEKCNNINYPFRTKCNRQNCGAERPGDANKPGGVAPEGDDQAPSRVSKIRKISPAKEFVATQLPAVASQGCTPRPRVSEIHQVSSGGQSIPSQPHPATSQPQQGVSGGSTPRSIANGSVVWSNEYDREMLDQTTRLTTTPLEASDATGPVVTPGRIRCGERGETLRSLYEFSEEGGRSSSYQQLVGQNLQFRLEILRLNEIIEEQRKMIFSQMDMHSEMLSIWAKVREMFADSTGMRRDRKEHLVGEDGDRNRVEGEDEEGEDKKEEVYREKDDG